jgi:hypothetical protein
MEWFSRMVFLVVPRAGFDCDPIGCPRRFDPAGRGSALVLDRTLWEYTPSHGNHLGSKIETMRPRIGSTLSRGVTGGQVRGTVYPADPGGTA